MRHAWPLALMLCAHPNWGSPARAPASRPMSELGQNRSCSHLGSMSGFPESGHCRLSQRCNLGDARFAERDLWNVGGLRPRHCGLMPANFTTLAHFSVSSAMNWPKSAGEPANTAHPKSVRRVFMVESARAALISWLSLSMIFVGVAFGTTIPYQPLAS